MATHSVSLITPEEYLVLDRASDIRHEYIFGEVVPILAATEQHGIIVGNAVYVLKTKLRGTRCQVFTAGPRLRLDPRGAYAYPDTMVVCGQREYTDDQEDTITNPHLALEVLSPSTRNYDLGAKRQMYLRIPSLKELLLIEQDRIGIERYWRRADGHWDRAEVEDGAATLQLEAIGIHIQVAELYEGVAWN